MQLILDFDYTLFDTAALKQAMIHALQQFGVTAEQFFVAEKHVKQKNGMYELQTHLSMLVEEAQHEAAMQSIQHLLQNTAQFLYPDVMPFLKRHAEHQLILLSFGNPDWQRAKIEHTGFLEVFHDILLTDQPKTEALRGTVVSQKTVLINDRGSEIDAIKQSHPELFAIWLRRPGTPYENENCLNADREVTELSFDINSLL